MTIIKKQTVTNVEMTKPSYFVSGNIEWYNHFGKQFGGSSKVKDRVTIRSSNSTPRSISKRNENMPTKKKKKSTQFFIASLFTKAKKVETIQMSAIDEWKRKCGISIQGSAIRPQKGTKY